MVVILHPALADKTKEKTSRLGDTPNLYIFRESEREGEGREREKEEEERERGVFWIHGDPLNLMGISSRHLLQIVLGWSSCALQRALRVKNNVHYTTLGEDLSVGERHHCQHVS